MYTHTHTPLQLTNLRSSVLPSLEKNLSEKSKTLDKFRTTSSKAKAEQTRLQSELQSVRELQPRVGKATHLRGALKELDRRISSEASRIGVGGSTRSQVMVNRDLQEANRAA